MSADSGRFLQLERLKKVVVYDVKTRGSLSATEVNASPKMLTRSGDDRSAFSINPDDNPVSAVDIVNGKRLCAFQTGKKPVGIGRAD